MFEPRKYQARTQIVLAWTGRVGTTQKTNNQLAWAAGVGCMTYTLIATNTLDACIRTCTPPSPSTYTVWHRHTNTTTHNIQRRAWGGEGRGHTQTPYDHPLSVGLSPPPPFDVVVWVLGLLLLVVLQLTLGRVFFRFSRVTESRESSPYCLLSPSSLSHSPVLHLALLSQNDASGIVTSVKIVECGS